jgi:hypothetical protein
MDPAQPDNGKPATMVHISLDYNMTTGVLAIAGSVPNNMVGLDMARRLVDEFEFRTWTDRASAAAAAVSLAQHLPPGLLKRPV